jgi:type VII secretion protein EccCb
VTSLPEELDDAFYAVADSMSIAEAERFARTMAPWRPVGAATAVTSDGPARDLLEVLGIRDARKLDVDRLWSARRTQNRLWMRFPIGLDPTGEVVELDLKETSQYGMGMHSVLIGFSGSGKSETIITEVTSLALTHSPETVNVAFLDWKMKSAGIVLERFPHVVASVSNLGDEMHLVERMLEALEGELDRRGALCAATNCKDLNVYNEKRMVDPSLEPVPGLVVIIDEYQELFRSDLGAEFVDLCWRIVRQGRSMHVFLQLAGQTVDAHRLMKIRSLIGFFMALRTGTEEDSREAIGSSIAAHLPEKGKEGTGYLREGMRPPREFRAFYSSPPFVPPPEDGGPAPVAAAGTWFTPRSFTATEVPDDDGLLAPPERNGHEPAPAAEQVAMPLAPGELPPTVVDTLVESLRATGARPPRQLWLPPLEKPATADELVRLVRGKPWDVDYGKTPGLAFPVGIEDRPRQHRQDVHFVDLLGANALVIGGPQSGVTTTLATMLTTAALMYRPERVQFYCVAAGGPSLAAVGGLPHVAGLAPAVDREGVGRIIASVQGIVAEREAVFAKTGLDMDEVRRRKFSDKPEPVPVAGGDIVLVIDGWAGFASEYPQYVDHIVALARSLSYGVHVVVSHTSYLQGFKQALKPLATERIELRLTDPGDSEMNRQLAKKVPRTTPGRGITKAGMHLLIGLPELGDWRGSDVAGQAAAGPDVAGGRVATRDIGPLIAGVSGIQKAATVSRLPESVPFEEVQRLAAPITRRSLVPFGLSELDLGPAYLDIADHPHAIAVGAPRSGRSNFLRVLCRALTSLYRPEEAQILVLDPRRTLLGVVQGPHLRDYAYTQSAIREAIKELVAELENRQPPPGTTQEEMMTKTFWSGPEIFVVIDDAGVWSTMDNPLMMLGPHIEGARDTGLHVFAATAVANWNQVAIGSSVLGKLRASLAPVLILDGRRDAGKIVADIFAEPQRPGKATYYTRSGTTGALIGWSNPPAAPSQAGPQT